MNVLVINCGSSSLKFQLIDAVSEKVLAKGICERIGIDGQFVYQPAGGEKEKSQKDMPTHTQAIGFVLEALTNDATGVLKSLEEIGAVGHRVVHGGEKFTASAIISEEMIAGVESCNDLAPLHNPANIIGIRACQELMPGVPMVGVFDTAFHQTMPKEAYMYGIPYEYYEKYGIRKYGFHGTSHSFVSKRACEFLGQKLDETKTVVCHLGNGSSICAVKFGKSIDTSMGMTPLEGVAMGTRSGSLDPAIIEFLMKKEDLTIDEAMSILNKKSGMFGLSGYNSSDFRDLTNSFLAGDEKATVALDVFAYRVAKTIGEYIMAMDGVDNIIFTAGIGENDELVRANVFKYLGHLGVELDEELNLKRGQELVISKPGSKITVAVIPTDEELAIARETLELVK